MEWNLISLFKIHHRSLSKSVILSLLFFFSFTIHVSCSGLSFGFYSFSCPNAELIVRNTVRPASLLDPTIPGKLLRLLFHDCMVEGCDASILVEGKNTEKTDPANKSLDGFEVINAAKRLLEMWCPGTVSCADIVALAARDAVEVVGGPFVNIPTGRRDGNVSLASLVRSNTIDTSFSIDEMAKLFISKGLSLDDLVTLSGAHTIGSSHCSAFSDRFEKNKKGRLELIDATLDRNYADQLMTICPADASEIVTVNNDPETSLTFDNQYYINLINGKGLFQSDSALFNDERTRERVEIFSKNQGAFFQSWQESFVKLSTVGVKTDGNGEIRMSCFLTNN